MTETVGKTFGRRPIRRSRKALDAEEVIAATRRPGWRACSSFMRSPDALLRTRECGVESTHRLASLRERRSAQTYHTASPLESVSKWFQVTFTFSIGEITGNPLSGNAIQLAEAHTKVA